LIEKYFDKIFTNVFADYWDLDKYEDSDYNLLNKSIIEILKINTINIIGNELSNLLINYSSQNILVNLETGVIKDILDNYNKNTELKKSIDLYLYNSMVIKLNIKNPDKNSYVEPEIQKKVIINELANILGESSFDSEDNEEINKILDFSKFLCENISWNCYEEMTKILYDLKKMSMYFKILNILNKY